MAWLVVEIGNLAVHLRDTAALDVDGVVQEQMARDLEKIGTRQDVMIEAFELARLRCKWLPRTPELLDLHTEVVERRRKTADAAAQAERDLKEKDLWKRKQDHPEEFFSMGGLLREIPQMAAHVEEVDRMKSIKERPVITREEKLLPDCPHCGKPIPRGVADLSFLSEEDLLSISRRRKEKREEMKAAIERVQGPAADIAALRTTLRNRRGAKA